MVGPRLARDIGNGFHHAHAMLEVFVIASFQVERRDFVNSTR
jgi:hypothetical protein